MQQQKNKQWREILNVVAAIAGIISCIAALIVVPEVRRGLGLDKEEPAVNVAATSVTSRAFETSIPYTQTTPTVRSEWQNYVSKYLEDPLISLITIIITDSIVIILAYFLYFSKVKRKNTIISPMMGLIVLNTYLFYLFNNLSIGTIFIAVVLALLSFIFLTDI